MVAAVVVRLLWLVLMMVFVMITANSSSKELSPLYWAEERFGIGSDVCFHCCDGLRSKKDILLEDGGIYMIDRRWWLKL